LSFQSVAAPIGPQTLLHFRGITKVALPAGSQTVFSAIEWKIELCQQDFNICLSASELHMMLAVDCLPSCRLVYRIDSVTPPMN